MADPAFRERDERLAQFVRWSTRLRKSRGAAEIYKVSWTIGEERGGEFVDRMTGPDEDEAISFFTQIRGFDTPKHPLYVLEILELLKYGASENRTRLLDAMIRGYARLGDDPFRGQGDLRRKHAPRGVRVVGIRRPDPRGPSQARTLGRTSAP